MEVTAVSPLGAKPALLAAVFALALLGPLAAAARSTSASAARAVPTAHVTRAPLMKMPGVTIPPEWELGDYSGVDSNSPVIWRDGKLHMYNSCCGMVYHSSGANLYGLGGSGLVEWNNDNVIEGARWMESVVTADDGTLYGFYHHELDACPGQGKRPIYGLVVPQIGMARSTDGMRWEDMGTILTAAADVPLKCDTESYWYAGGVGDLSAIRARDGYVYVFFGTFYGDDVTEQGIAVARLPTTELDNPVGKAMKWRAGRWDEPGLGGHVTPVMQSYVGFHELKANGWWGPVVSWNTYLKQYVMVFNRIKDYIWTAEGAYVAFTRTLSKPFRWSAPQRLIKLNGTTQADGFAEAIGTNVARQETDTLMGRRARFFRGGRSKWKIVFRKGRKCAGRVTFPYEGCPSK